MSVVVSFFSCPWQRVIAIALQQAARTMPRTGGMMKRFLVVEEYPTSQCAADHSMLRDRLISIRLVALIGLRSFVRYGEAGVDGAPWASYILKSFTLKALYTGQSGMLWIEILRHGSHCITPSA